MFIKLTKYNNTKVAINPMHIISYENHIVSVDRPNGYEYSVKETLEEIDAIIAKWIATYQK